MTEDASKENLRHRLAEKMAGEITLSDKPGEALKKWRLNFEIAQTDISSYLGVSPSVISDYESGRRKSPGTLIVSKIVDALINIDSESGGHKIHAYEGMLYSDQVSKAVYATSNTHIQCSLQNWPLLSRRMWPTGVWKNPCMVLRW